MIELVHRFIIPAAYSLLPLNMNSPEATTMLLAIGMQESRFEAREQRGGPARSFWQFEAGGGCAGVLTHAASRDRMRAVLTALRYPAQLLPSELHRLIADNDVLAAVAARLLLWTDPQPAPKDAQTGWDCYARVWRPGKPHRETWDGYYAAAVERVASGH